MDEEKRAKIIIGLAFLYLPLLLYSFYAFHLRVLLANWHLNRGEAYLKYSAFRRVYREYERALEVGGPTLAPYTRYRYGLAVLSNAKLARYFDKEVSPEVLKRGLALQEKNNARVWENFTRNYTVAGRLSNALFERGEKEYEKKASRYFQKALELSPERPSIYLDMARTDIIAGDLGEAEKDIERALAINENNEKALWELTLLRVRQQRFGEAEKRIAEQGWPFGFDRMNEIGRAYEEAGREKTALRFYEFLAASKPRVPRYRKKVKELSGDFR